MAKHKVRVTQVFRVEKSIILEIEADNAEDAVETVSSGEVWLPPAEEGITNSAWGAGQWSLKNEEVEAA